MLQATVVTPKDEESDCTQMIPQAAIVTSEGEGSGTEMAIVEYHHVNPRESQIEYGLPTPSSQMKPDDVEFLTPTPEEQYFRPQQCMQCTKYKVACGVIAAIMLLSFILSLVAVSKSSSCSDLEVEVVQLRSDLTDLKSTVAELSKQGAEATNDPSPSFSTPPTQLPTSNGGGSSPKAPTHLPSSAPTQTARQVVLSGAGVDEIVLNASIVQFRSHRVNRTSEEAETQS